ncbi:MAG TPA: hypothetical protein VMF32_23105 [Xanthobacteraceae bacterium]|nr:hypothetical protein [Xanthobacteraceae bacterium]
MERDNPNIPSLPADRIPAECVREFIRLYEEIFGETIAEDAARSRLRQLFTLYVALLRKPPAS